MSTSTRAVVLRFIADLALAEGRVPFTGEVVPSERHLSWLLDRLDAESRS